MSVIVPAFQAAATIGVTLSALAGQDLPGDYEVIVVDDGSSDRTAEIAASFPGVIVLHQENQGPGPARNLGVARAGGEILAFTDADCRPEGDWLRRGVAAIEGLDLLQGAVRPDRGASRHPLDRTLWVTGESGLYESANLFIRRPLFEELGGFEDFLGARIGKPLAEDVWLGWRARRSRARVGFSDRSVVEHAVFRRGLMAHVAERARLAYFPAIVAQIPELRGHMMFLRLFLNRRTALFDLALVALLSAVVGKRRLLLAGAAPYAGLQLRDAFRWRRLAPLALAAGTLADLVGLVALLIGSIRNRTPLI